MISWRFQKSKQKWWRQSTHGHLIESPLWLMYMWNWHAIICNFTPRVCVNDWSNGSARSCCIWEAGLVSVLTCVPFSETTPVLASTLESCLPLLHLLYLYGWTSTSCSPQKEHSSVLSFYVILWNRLTRIPKNNRNEWQVIDK